MGRAFALAFAGEGASVGVLDRDEVGAERVAKRSAIGSARRDRPGGGREAARSGRRRTGPFIDRSAASMFCSTTLALTDRCT
jgi:NAD(P)-dependent dehydrogenase (short-subunit alcohol dehydrogenase family)